MTPDCFLLSSGRKFHGHSSLKEYYEKESCVHYIHNVSSCCQRQSVLCVCSLFTKLLVFQVKVPLLLVNAADDPLVHDSLLAIPRTLAGNWNHFIHKLDIQFIFAC